MSDGEDQLIHMANDIGSFFHGEPRREDAIDGIVNHIAKYWTRRMREKLIVLAQQTDSGLDDLPRAAVAKLATAV